MKVALSIPCHGSPKAEFTQCLARMINFTKTQVPPLELEIFLVRSADIFAGRQQLVDAALEWGADYMLWLDADHVFPDGALVKLLQRQVDVVGANYRRRGETNLSVAARRENGGWVPVFPSAESAAADVMQEVDRIGFGLLLMKLSALETVERPLFAGGEGLSEDVALCDKLRAAGVKIHVDDRLSMSVGHIAESILRFPPKTIAVPTAR